MTKNCPLLLAIFEFNGWNHLPENRKDEYFGAVQGEKLTSRILKHKLPWNRAFNRPLL